MLKLKQLQQKQQQAAEQPPAAPAEPKPEGDAPADGEVKEGYVLKKQNSKELAEVRQEKTRQGVLSLKAKGKRTGGKAKQNAAELRAQKDISEMDTEATPGVKVDFPNPDNLMNFTVTVKPNDGMYKAAEFQFTVDVPNTYPYDPPKVVCNTLVYHPNIDWKGAVCLNILRADWKPVLTLGSVLFGLMTLFLEPNPDDPLNKEAAEQMVNKRAEFEKMVKQTLKGGFFFGKQFPKLCN